MVSFKTVIGLLLSYFSRTSSVRFRSFFSQPEELREGFCIGWNEKLLPQIKEYGDWEIQSFSITKQKADHEWAFQNIIGVVLLHDDHLMHVQIELMLKDPNTHRRTRLRIHRNPWISVDNEVNIRQAKYKLDKEGSAKIKTATDQMTFKDLIMSLLNGTDIGNNYFDAETSTCQYFALQVIKLLNKAYWNDNQESINEFVFQRVLMSQRVRDAVNIIVKAYAELNGCGLTKDQLIQELE